MAKSQSSNSSSRDAELLSTLAGRTCPHCPNGELVRGEYKDNRAVLCDSCETPQVQIW